MAQKVGLSYSSYPRNLHAKKLAVILLKICKRKIYGEFTSDSLCWQELSMLVIWKSKRIDLFRLCLFGKEKKKMLGFKIIKENQI